ncbi:MAG: hypothetical protein RJQ14_12085 [Marinoscillum sp.]
MGRFLFSFLFSIIITAIQAQDTTDQHTPGKSGLLVLPAIFYSPETSWGFGVAGIQYFRMKGDSVSKPSNVQSVLIYTLEKQVLITFPYNLFFNKEKYWLKGEWAYYIYPYEYYGIGTDVDLGNDGYETYTANFLRMETNALIQARKDLYVGGTMFFDNYFEIDINPTGALQSQNIRGTEAGKLLGLGALMILDKRNNIFSPSGGYYLESRVLRYEDQMVGDYAFTDLYVDMRKYFQPADKWETAFQVYHQSVLGEPPFYNYALLGGGKIMRGYYKGGYRDHHQTVVQTELRRYVTNRIVASAFGGLGSVTGSFGAYDKVLGSYGVGIRYEINTAEKLRIRLDYARGANTSGFYININEAF